MTSPAARRLAFLSAVSIVLLGCNTEKLIAPPLPPPTLRSLEARSPVLVGTKLVVKGRELFRLGETPELVLELGSEKLVLPAGVRTGMEEVSYSFTQDAASLIGDGMRTLSVRLRGNGLVTEPALDVVLRFASRLDIGIASVPPLQMVRYNDQYVIEGTGFLDESEGRVEAVLDGMATPAIGSAVAASGRIAVTSFENARTRGLLRIPSTLAVAPPFGFEGRLHFESVLKNGTQSRSPDVSVAFRVEKPIAFRVEPARASLGQYITVKGAGFVNSQELSQLTTIRFVGTVTPTGGTPVALDRPLVPEFVDGQTLRFGLRYKATDDLRSPMIYWDLMDDSLLIRTARVEGTAQIVATVGGQMVSSEFIPFAFELAPPKQVVHLKFLPGFYDSLTRFGLLNAADRISIRVKERIERIYADYGLYVRLDAPPDYLPNGYVSIELGGPDPTGGALFGYDNSPGKDINNTRLGDQIGGLNAETQMDGSPGYGGVFTESYLWWSREPRLPIPRPREAPAPDPLFDEIFLPVRNSPATLSELDGNGAPARVAEVQRAFRALASMIGETTAHEIGHSLGLARPRGSRNEFHNFNDGEGCLMDSGGNRTIAERTEEPDAPVTQFCYDEPGYLLEVLGPRD